MSQYGYQLECGRRGATLSVFRLDASGGVEYTWKAIFNSRGMEVVRSTGEGIETQLAHFETFLYPDRVEEDELAFVDLLSMSPVDEDHDFIRLCSFLVAKWAAGHNEEMLHDVIRSTIKKWAEGVNG